MCLLLTLTEVDTVSPCSCRPQGSFLQGLDAPALRIEVLSKSLKEVEKLYGELVRDLDSQDAEEVEHGQVTPPSC